jgi:hypothetical protein
MSTVDPKDKDIQAAELPAPRQPGQPEELQLLYEAAVKKCTEAMAWYASHRKARKRWGQGFRIGAILFGAMTGLTPIIVQLLGSELINPRLSLLASIFAVLGATCVGLDNYLGSSSGWMRYIASYFELSARLETLRFHWSRQALAPQFPEQKEQLRALLELLQVFLADVNAVIQKETQEWMAEFKGNLLLLEQRVEAQRSIIASTVTVARHGALKVQVENAVALNNGAWRVLVGTSRILEGSGSQARVATELPPGQYRIRLEAQKGGAPYVSEDVVSIGPEATATYTFEVE